jgi:hypothetical protein
MCPLSRPGKTLLLKALGQNGVHFGHTHGIAGTPDGRHIPAFMDMVSNNSQVWLAFLQHSTEFSVSLRRHLGGFFKFFSNSIQRS